MESNSKSIKFFEWLTKNEHVSVNKIINIKNSKISDNFLLFMAVGFHVKIFV